MKHPSAERAEADEQAFQEQGLRILPDKQEQEALESKVRLQDEDELGKNRDLEVYCK